MKPWEDKDSIWKTEAAFRSWKRGGYRRMWSKYPLKIAFIKNHRFKAPIGKNNAMVWAGHCNICKKTFRTAKLQVDHLHPNPPLADGEQEYLNSLFITQKEMQWACKPCHDIITLAERLSISFDKAKGVKSAIKICKLSGESQKKWLTERGITDDASLRNAKTRRAAIERYINEQIET